MSKYSQYDKEELIEIILEKSKKISYLSSRIIVFEKSLLESKKQKSIINNKRNNVCKYLLANGMNIDTFRKIEQGKTGIDNQEKLNIAKRALKYYADSYIGEEYETGKSRVLISDDKIGNHYLCYDSTIARKALEEINMPASE